MLDVDLIRNNPELIKKNLEERGYSPKLVDRFLSIDQDWREKTKAVDNLRAQRNIVSKQLSKTKSKDLILKAQLLKQRLKKLEKEKRELELERMQRLYLIPNLHLKEVPIGKSELDNLEIKRVGQPRKLNFKPSSYLEIGQRLNVIDIERSVKTSGTRFGSLLGKAAILEFALINFVISKLTNRKFLTRVIQKNRLRVSAKEFYPILPPVMLNFRSMQGMGYLDWGKEEVYHIEKDNLYLVGTSEQSIGARHQNEIFKKSDLPKRYLGFSTCFRREAGSYGKDTKGIIRVHQFDKLEMFSFCLPSKSRLEHKFFLALEEALMQELNIPYRVISICTADLGQTAAQKYDIEAYIPSENRYIETHSTSNCTDYQARRLNIKYREKDKTDFVHTINGTVFAMGRIIVSIIENYQTANKDFEFPPVLKPYLKCLS